MIETDIKNINFKCPNCSNTGSAVEVRYRGGTNDSGGFVLECQQCSYELFLRLKNPSEHLESKITSDSFKVLRVIDFDHDEDKELIEKKHKTRQATDILVVSGQSEMPLLKGAWKSLPAFAIHDQDEIFICNKCRKNIESEIYDQIKSEIDQIQSSHNAANNWYIKSRCNPEYLTVNSITQCDGCGSSSKFTAYSKYPNQKNQIERDDFYISDVGDFQPNINGIYTRAQSKRFLEKFVLRWSLIASKIIVVSPFIGFDKRLSIKTPYKFLSLLEWFLTLNSFNRTQVLIRKSEYGKIKEVIGSDIFNLLNGYGLLNNLIEEMNQRTPRFHAKFYAGIIPNGDESYVEILTGSYNLHEESDSKENLVYIKMSLDQFQKQYLDPLKISIEHFEYPEGFEILAVEKDRENLKFPKTIKDITN